MANGLQLNTSTPFAGLGTATYTIVTTGIYTVSVKSTIPYIAAGTSNNSTVTTGGSALQIVINQNGSPILTSGGVSTNPTPTQPSLGARISFQATAADVITVVFSSANAVDAVPNAVKSIINLYAGQ